MRNLRMQSGENLTLLAPYAVSGGQGMLVGLIFGIASTAAALGASVAVSTLGVYDITKAAGQAFGVGAAVYWDNAARNVTTVAADNTKIGVTIAAAAAGDAVAQVRLNGTF